VNSNLLLLAIPGTAFAAFLLPLLLQRFGRVAAALAAAAVIGSCLALVLPLAPAVFAGETQLARWPGCPPTDWTSACASMVSGCSSAC
jgi:hypothetical protein